MKINKIDGALYKLLVINGAENLKRNYQTIDALNVFPVPDGDTGTNMRMTIEGGVNEIAEFDSKNIYEVAKKVSRGMLMGARGNSGVILSQLFRGISKGFEKYTSVTAISLAKAFKSGVEQAYKAVLTPAEGTILTVAREATEKLVLIASSRMSINEFFDEFIMEAKASLDRTPDLLPVLKEAGVVDSGGAGLVCILEGMRKAVNGEMLDSQETMNFGTSAVFEDLNKEEAEFGYCTEFILKLDKEKVGSVEEFSENTVLDQISPIGNSIVIVKDEDIVKVHVHTLTPGVVLNIGQQYGEFVKLKIENMTLQHTTLAGKEEKAVEIEEEAVEVEEKPVKPAERSKYAVVAVASGEGLTQTFKELGVDYVVSGGQSMNPSTEDFIKGFDHLNAENIIVFPNNKNIILAANQAAKIYDESNVVVIPSKTIAQGFSALTMIDLSSEVEDIVNDMKEQLENVTSIAITYAIRKSKVNGVNVEKNDYIGMLDGKLVSAHRHLYNTFKEVVDMAVNEDKSLVTIIYGKGVSEKEANDAAKYVQRNHSNVDVQVVNGGQDVYNYIVAVE